MMSIMLGSTSLKDYYDINIKSLGKGSYGSVVAARDLRTGTTKAVKIVYKPKIENITRLKREILIMSVGRVLYHLKIVTVRFALYTKYEN